MSKSKAKKSVRTTKENVAIYRPAVWAAWHTTYIKQAKETRDASKKKVLLAKARAMFAKLPKDTRARLLARNAA